MAAARRQLEALFASSDASSADELPGVPNEALMQRQRLTAICHTCRPRPQDAQDYSAGFSDHGPRYQV